MGEVLFVVVRKIRRVWRYLLCRMVWGVCFALEGTDWVKRIKKERYNKHLAKDKETKLRFLSVFLYSSHGPAMGVPEEMLSIDSLFFRPLGVVDPDLVWSFRCWMCCDLVRAIRRSVRYFS